MPWAGRGIIPLSNVIRKDHDCTLHIQTFDLQEVSAADLHQQGSVVHVPRVIRDTADCPYPIEIYPLYDMDGKAPEAHIRAAYAPEIAHAPADSPPAAEFSLVPSTATAESEEHWQQAADLLIQQAQEEAEGCLARAQKEAEDCLAQAQERAAALAQEAYDDGFKQGEEAAREEIAERFATLFASLEQAWEALSRGRAEALRLAEEDIITLALQLAQKIVHYEVSGHRQVFATTLQRALTFLVDCDRVVIRVNPTDLVQAQELQPHLVGSRGLSTAPILCGDESIGRGGCVVDSEFGSIDARIEAQFAELEQHLRAHLSQEGAA